MVEGRLTYWCMMIKAIRAALKTAGEHGPQKTGVKPDEVSYIINEPGVGYRMKI